MAIEWLKGFIISAGALVIRVFRRAAPVAVAGYLVVAIFGLSILFVKSRWPALRDATVTTIVLLVAAPLAMALLWHRLTSVKAFGLEVSLAESSVQTNAELVAAITGRQYFSGEKHIIDQIRNAIVRGETEIVEINLRNGDYWWSTRLYLLAALADDYSTIQAFAFVGLGIQRRFLGLCTPAVLRKAIAKAFPTFAEVYAELNGQWPAVTAPGGRVENIVHSWAAHTFEGKSELEFSELESKGKVSAQLLGDWLSQAGEQLSTDSIDWCGISDSHLLRQILIGYREPYVALLRNGRLDRIVNRFALTVRIAEQTLKS
ncbi:MAG TPA: hypothetical protein VEM96_20665 [Pyrinomonadaceae bacterium]|nr:hypothetical protein [Pyrinomonadaceae bacterium]